MALSERRHVPVEFTPVVKFGVTSRHVAVPLTAIGSQVSAQSGLLAAHSPQLQCVSAYTMKFTPISYASFDSETGLNPRAENSQ